eukprot:gnl/Dysnectes_brevis/1349_a1515_1766.p1 GENE.gnl/Dysnectes_brevis/1349_a1515_1766~~gnl/Dysnectes_brevis/1349_a1515_1766.p1  ORF type:complete len:404 (+),score=112.10 gnl/Dysnectes_brevis/1349_a1515_1766:1827-3038(+)
MGKNQRRKKRQAILAQDLIDQRQKVAQQKRIASLDDDQIFEVDDGSETVQKMLWVDRVLLPSAGDAIKTRSTKAGDLQKRGNDMLVEKTVKAIVSGESIERKKEHSVGTADFDLWDDSSTKKAAKMGRVQKVIVKSSGSMNAPTIRRPKRLVPEPTPKEKAGLGKMSAVVPSSGGSSYHPSYEQHQRALARATAQVVSENTYREKLKANNPPRVQIDSRRPQIVAQMARLAGAVVPDNAVDEPELSDASEGPVDDGKVALREIPKLSERQRRKVHRKAASHASLLHEQKKKLQESSVLAFFQEREEIRDAGLDPDADEEKTSKRRFPRGTGRRPGKQKLIPRVEDVPLTEDLRGSMRQIRADGNLWHDRFHSLHQRNIVPTTLKRRKSKEGWFKTKIIKKDQK